MSEDYIWKVAQSVGFDDYELKPMLEAFAAALSQPAPSPQPSVPVVSDDILIEREYERVMGQHLRPQDRAGVLKVCRAILALRPAVEYFPNPPFLQINFWLQPQTQTGHSP